MVWADNIVIEKLLFFFEEFIFGQENSTGTSSKTGGPADHKSSIL